MNKPKVSSIYLPLAAAAALAVSVVSSQAQSASATLSDTAVAGGFDYTITLDNTGSSSLEGFWYGWTDFGNNLPSNPTTAGNSLGWVNNLDGNSIQWQGGAGNALAAGNTATFTFFSTSTPTAITTTPSGPAISGQSVAYTGTIQFNEGVSGVSTPVFSPVLVAAPEPASMALLAVGSLGLLAGGWRKLRAQQ